jgi:hypothetical protein
LTETETKKDQAYTFIGLGEQVEDDEPILVVREDRFRAVR